jgi:hypothetical protein
LHADEEIERLSHSNRKRIAVLPGSANISKRDLEYLKKRDLEYLEKRPRISRKRRRSKRPMQEPY